MEPIRRDKIFPEQILPRWQDAVAEGHALARHVSIGSSAFQREYGIESEAAFKCQEVKRGRIMQHAQIGYRGLDKTLEAARTIHKEVADAGYRVDRYGICLDWSMGYPRSERSGRPTGTGLILASDQAFCRLADAAPVALHFGDFVIGMPAALENTAAALRAGSTAIGNLGQYFTFELPGWGDDIATTYATVSAIALTAAQPVPILVHSNVDDGFAARFSDLASALGAVLLETYIVNDLLGGTVSHCYGHTFSKPLSRFSFHRALAGMSRAPGTMVFGNTTAYRNGVAENYAALGAYLTVDILAQKTNPTGHAVNPVPITEAQRIPDIDEIVEAQVFCGQYIQRLGELAGFVDPRHSEELTNRLSAGADRFKSAVLEGLDQEGFDIADPIELLLALRRIGAKRLEQLFGPGAPDPNGPNGRRPVESSPVIQEISDRAEEALEKISTTQRTVIDGSRLRVLTATTDVHEYGKRLLDEVLIALNVTVIDGGVSTDPDLLADMAGGADVILLSTYNGVALHFLTLLNQEMNMRNLHIPIFIGGKLNQVPSKSNTSLPVDVAEDLAMAGSVVCRSIEDLFAPLAKIAEAHLNPD